MADIHSGQNWKRQALRQAVLAGILVALVAVGGRAGAQEERGTTAADIVSSMRQVLKLSAEQARQIKGVIEEELRQVRMIRAEGLSEEKQNRRIMEVRREQEAQLKNYLTEEQLAQWLSLKVQAASPDASRKGEKPAGQATSEGTAQPAANTDGVLQSTPSTRLKSGVY